MKRGPKPKPAIDRIMENYTPEPNSGCWLWTGSCHRQGYGKLTVNGKTVGAHRESFRALRGDPGVFQVLHKCDTPACINPDHLFLGTHYDNIVDRLAKNRWPARNKGPRKRGGSTYLPKMRKWQSQVTVAGADFYLGVFNTQKEADDAAELKRSTVLAARNRKETP